MGDRINIRDVAESRADQLRVRLLEIKRETSLSYEKLAYGIGVSFYTVLRWINLGMKRPRPSSVRLLEIFVKKFDKAKEEGRLEEFLAKFIIEVDINDDTG